MPDDMDPNYAAEYPHQPYNGNPHMHPGEQVLMRVIGQGRWQHPFHEHGNHVRILARDGNLILSADRARKHLAGRLLFTTTTTPGLALDGIFYWTGRGLNWDVYGHNPKSGDALQSCCTPDANGYNTGATATSRSTTTSGARTITSRWRSLPSAMWLAAARHSARSEYLHQRRLVRRQPVSRADATHRAQSGANGHARPPRAPIRKLADQPKPASRSCGTRTTSARSPPTIFSRAE